MECNGKKKNLFISLPMRGKTDDQIKRMIKICQKKAEELLGEDLFLLPSYEKGLQSYNPVFGLAHALLYLADADIVFFAPEWNNSKGCNVEMEVCKSYNIDFIDGNDVFFKEIVTAKIARENILINILESDCRLEQETPKEVPEKDSVFKIKINSD